MRKVAAAAFMVAALAFSLPANAQIVTDDTLCESVLRYSDGTVPDPLNLRVNRVLEHPLLPGVPFPIEKGTTLEKVCTTVAPTLSLFVIKDQESQALRTQLDQRDEEDGENATKVITYETDPVYLYAYRIVWYAGLVTAIFILTLFWAWKKERIKRTLQNLSRRKRVSSLRKPFFPWLKRDPSKGKMFRI